MSGHVVVCLTEAQADAIEYAAALILEEWETDHEMGGRQHHHSTIKGLQRGLDRLVHARSTQFDPTSKEHNHG